MAVGMGTVFGFLGLLVLLMHGSAAWFAAWAERFPEPAPAPPGPAPAAGAAEAEIAVILAAIAAHRAGRR